MLVKEFIEQMDNEPLASCAAPGYYMGLFLTILEEFRDEKCSVLLGKIMANMDATLGSELVCKHKIYHRKT